jgi:branched-chain amino acid transport system ATP-binding protein
LILQVESISKSFSELVVLNHLSFGVREGELKAIIGPNGAGKTTLFNVISGHFPPDAGRILLRGKNITSAKPHVISRMGMARSFQLNNFFTTLTTLENVRLSVQSRLKKRTSIWRSIPKSESAEEKAHEIMEWVGLGEHASEIAGNLSYGDQRKLEIALALGTNPSLLLLDEPTSGMSRFESSAMIELIEKVSKRVTIVLIEHDIELVMKVSDSILVIHYGERIAEGNPSEIEKNEEVQRIYLGGL